MNQSAASAAYEEQSPTLLAQQPISLSAPQESVPNWDVIYAYLENRLSQLRNWRWSWWAAWATLAEFILPERYHWVITPNRMAKGSPLNNAIVDSTATLAMKICASGLWTGLTSPSRPWFKLGIGVPWLELDADGKAWLEDTEQKIYTVLAQSNYYTTMAQAFRDVATFGTAPVTIYEDFEDVIRCYLPCAGEYFLAAGSRLSIDTQYREFVMTVEQVVGMFTLNNCPADIRELWRNGSVDTEVVVCHAIEPNTEIADKKTDGSVRVVSGIFLFREVYWLKGNKGEGPLSVRGFHERPFMAARWSVVSNDPYGRSPGMDAIGDTKQVQLETRRKAEFIDKGVRPPMGADPALKNEPSSIISGNITYVNSDSGKKGFWPLFEPNAAWLKGISDDIDKVNNRIERCFFVDVFLAISRMEGVQPRNELELTKRDLERLQVLGPFINLFETEFAGPAIQRVMSILERRRLLKPMPPSLRRIPLKVDYISIMKLAQAGSEAVGLKDFAVTGAQAAQAAQASGVPNPLRIVDWDKWYRRYATATNTPNEILFTEEEVEQHDQEHAALIKQQQAISTGMAGVTAAQALGNTPTGSGTALGALLGHGGATPLDTSGGGQ